MNLTNLDLSYTTNLDITYCTKPNLMNLGLSYTFKPNVTIHLPEQQQDPLSGPKDAPQKGSRASSCAALCRQLQAILLREKAFGSIPVTHPFETPHSMLRDS